MHFTTMKLKPNQLLKIILLFSFFIVKAFCQTQSNPKQAQTYRYLIFTEDCYSIFFKDFNFQHAECKNLASAKALGIMIIVGAFVSRIPQITKIVRKKSTLGLSLEAVVLQEVTQTSALAYNIFKKNPFTLYGQAILINFQMMIIHFLFILFDKQKRKKSLLLFPTVFIFFLAGLFAQHGFFPEYILQNTMVLQIILMLTAYLSQIHEIHKIKSTGNLDFIPYGSTVLGSGVRIFTILVEGKSDYLLLLSFSIALVLNAYICLCFLLFKQPKKEVDKKQQ